MTVDKATKILTLNKVKSQGTRDKIGKQDTHNMQNIRTLRLIVYEKSVTEILPLTLMEKN